MKKLLLIVTATIASATAADHGWKLPAETAKLERAPGVELVTAQCLLCHSADYIAIQPRINRAAWTATVTKMKDKYGAPIQQENIEAIVNYLATAYGTEKSDKPRREK